MLDATTCQLPVPLLQGVFSPSTFGMLELPGNWYPALEWQYPPHQRQGSYEEEGRCVNTMKVGQGAELHTTRCSVPASREAFLVVAQVQDLSLWAGQQSAAT